MAIQITPLSDVDFVDEYGYFGEMGVELVPTRLSYMREEGWDAFTADLTRAITDYYYFSYIGTHPLAKWEKMALSALNRAVQNHYPEISLLYSQDEEINLLDGGETGHKNKAVNSQFPQSAIQEAEAYATDSTDDVGREVKTLGAIEAIKQARDPENPYENVLQSIIKEIGHCFSVLDF